MTPIPLPPPQMVAMPGNMPPPSIHGNGSAHGTNQMLDYLESQMRGMDVTSPLHMPPPPQHMPQHVPFSAGPPSTLSGLDNGPTSRRVLPGSRGGRPQAYSSGSSTYGASQRNDRHYHRPAILRSYSQEDVLDTRSQSRAHRPRSCSRDDLLADDRRGPSRRDDYSPLPRRGSLSSANDEDSRLGGTRGGRGGGWSNHPPSYTEYEPGKKPMKRPERFSDKSSRSGTRIVI
ncbi:uncharacterized protein LOC107720746 [Sinocyclocheilus rhinocerous]|uniref:uncharacterized protein LOC107720746 n=1 Tax=Sinocyclocheilus rhinocerous TaxID=307959 RepID=UPI0007B8342B|nr:PREDICTED: uncharacterized protein LOC107720746 [Sinocyclocheilus rhinocerous]